MLDAVVESHHVVTEPAAIHVWKISFNVHPTSRHLINI